MNANQVSDFTVTEAATRLGLCESRVRQLIAERWLEISNPRRHRGVALRVTSESVKDCAENWRSSMLTHDDKRSILRALSDIGIVGSLEFDRPHKPIFLACRCFCCRDRKDTPQ